MQLLRKLDPLCEAVEGTATDVDNLFSPGADSAIGGVGFGDGIGITATKGKEVDAVLRPGSRDVEHILLDLDEHEGSTLIACEEEEEEQGGVMKGVKEMDIEVTDDEDADAAEQPGPTGSGIKRKRTIRLIIRSRAFL